jgi:hypothetical protein
MPFAGRVAATPRLLAAEPPGTPIGAAITHGDRVVVRRNLLTGTTEWPKNGKWLRSTGTGQERRLAENRQLPAHRLPYFT